MTTSKRVTLDTGRTFIVDFDEEGDPVRIKERKKYGKYPLDGWYNAPYWSAKHHQLGSPDTIPARVLALAKVSS